MVTKHQRAAAARARAARWPCTARAISNSRDVPVSNAAAAAIEINSDSEWNCGYTGGVNHQFCATKYDSGTESKWSSGSGSGEDSMVELEGDELDANLHKLRKKVHAKALEVFLKYARVVTKKSAFEWKKAEKNRALDLGYTGNSQQTQQRREKEAWDFTGGNVRYNCMEAYQSGLSTKDAQIQVRKFSSTTYKSHQRIPDAVASAFD